MRDLRRAIVNTRPNVVISYEDVLNVGVVVSLLGTQIPVVVTEHCDPRHHRIPVLWRCLRPWVYRRASAVVVLNDSIREWCLEHWPGCHLVTIPNAISLQRPARSVELLATDGEHMVLAMGRLVRAKGFDLLVEAFARISDECAAWRLVILGDGPERPALEQSIRHLRLVDRVTLPGAVSTPETFMASAELFVVSSRYEGFCLALVEAMASGIPVVSFACPSGPPAIIRQGIDGVLVPPEDVSALANALRDLMLDRSRRDELRNAALKAAQVFEASRVMPTWCRLISDVVAASSRS
jgi:glycosyltransferase involved in cell wall biosynthesis